MCFIKHKSKPLYRWDNPVLASSTYHMYRVHLYLLAFLKHFTAIQRQNKEKTLWHRHHTLKSWIKRFQLGKIFFFLMHNSYWFEINTIQKGDLMCQQEGHLFWFPSRFYTVGLKLDFKNESIKHFWIFYNIFYPFNTFEICLIFFSVHSLS